MGSLPSNHLVLAGQDIEPIHSIVERQSDGTWKITDLGSEAGIIINGTAIDVEANLTPGDKVTLGGVELHFEEQAAAAIADGEDIPDDKVAKGAVLPPSDQPKAKSKSKRRKSGAKKEDNLFKIKSGHPPRGKTLEVVAYWGDRVLEIEHYHKPGQVKDGPTEATIGLPPEADFIAAGEEKLTSYTIARATSSGFTLSLRDGMKARLRRSGKVKHVKKGGKFKLSFKDIADVEYGPIRYFFLYVTLPKLQLPKQSPRDPLFLAFLWLGTAAFGLFAAILIASTPPEKDRHRDDDIWSVLSVTKEVDQVKKEKKKEQSAKKIVKIKHKPKPEVKRPVPQIQEKPKPKVDPKKLAEKAKPKVTTQAKPKPKLRTIAPPPAKKTAPTSQVAKNPGASAPARPAPGPKATKPRGPSGGAGNNVAGGQRKGKGANSAAGVEGVSNNKSSGVNLSKLGQSAGKIFNKSGAGAIQTNFRSSGGGLGGGSGSGTRHRGLGGSLSQGSALGLQGSSGQLNNFGSGGGGLIAGQGGGFSGMSSGRSQRAVRVGAAGAPGVSGGLSSEQIGGVIRNHHNAIRHCYEKSLQKQPNLAGKIRMKFVIGANGGVLSVSTEQDSLGSGELSGCILAKIRTWRFPKPTGGQKVTVTYPWVFKPSA